MKLIALLTCLTLSCCLGVNAQQRQPAVPQPEVRQVSVPYAKTPAPLVFVNQHHQETNMRAFIVDPNDIQRLDVLQGNKALDKFGDKGQAGVVVVTLKEEIPLARLQAIYEEFGVPVQQQHLSVAINGQHVEHPELLLADLRQIRKVEIATFDTSPTRWSFDEHYLNIVTEQAPQP